MRHKVEGKQRAEENFEPQGVIYFMLYGVPLAKRAGELKAKVLY